MKAAIREKILALRAKAPAQTFTLRELIRRLEIEVEQRKTLLEVLAELEESGLLYHLKRSKYGFTSVQRTLVGRLEVHHRGFGFVRPEGGAKGDIYVGPRSMGSAVHGDRVVIEVAPAKFPVRRGLRRSGKPLGRKRTTSGIGSDEELQDRSRGRVVQVLERANQRLIGRLFVDRDTVFVQPLDERLMYQVRLTGAGGQDLREGTIVEVEVLVQPGRHNPALGRIRTVVGLPDDKDLALKIILCKYKIPVEFPHAVMAEAQAISPVVMEQDMSGRRDFRSWPTVTIDGETARDFDDAITLAKHSDGSFMLGVHIADVSHYVREGSLLDREAFERGNSVYFPDRAIPMLPAQLSSGICSLNPDIDRLVFSVLMQVSPEGAVVHHEFSRGVIRSDARMTYTAVGKILLQRDPEHCREYASLLSLFENMRELCEILIRKRRARGAIDLDLPEAEVLLDESGAVLDVVKAERNIAHRIIEEFMLLANETVAARLAALQKPALYRIHEPPEKQRVQEFSETVRLFGYALKWSGNEPSPMDFQRLSDQLQQGPENYFLSYLMLRSFMQARYSETNEGHFGLASPEYTHFTSPIRRYADLVVHRLLAGSPPPASLSEEKWASELDRLRAVATQASFRERTAADAEREMVDYYRAVLMSERIGHEYDGFISNTTSSGFFVQLDQHFVEGFVPAAFIEDDYYVYRPDLRSLVGRSSKRSFRLGDRVRVMIDSVDMDSRRILLSLC